MKNLKKLVLLITLVVACGQQAVAMKTEKDSPNWESYPEWDEGLYQKWRNSRLATAVMSDDVGKVKRFLSSDYLTSHSHSVASYVVNEKDHNGNTPLHLAVSRRGVEIFEVLLNDPRTKVNEKNNDGKTALHYAIVRDYYAETVWMLLWIGRAKVEMNDEIIKNCKFPEIVEMIKRYRECKEALNNDTEMHMKDIKERHCFLFDNTQGVFPEETTISLKVAGFECTIPKNLLL